jgi:hypothetical protein
VSFDDMPANWEDCTLAQLRWLAEHGAYGQRLIANRYLQSRAALLTAHTNDDRARIKAAAPPPRPI